MLGSLPYLVGVLLMCFYFSLLFFSPKNYIFRQERQRGKIKIVSGWDFWPLSPNRIPGKLRSSHNILRMQQHIFIVQEFRTPTRHPVSSDPPCHTKCIQDRQYSILRLCTKKLKITNSICKTFSFFMCRGQHSTNSNIDTPTTRLGKGK